VKSGDLVQDLILRRLELKYRIRISGEASSAPVKAAEARREAPAKGELQPPTFEYNLPEEVEDDDA